MLGIDAAEVSSHRAPWNKGRLIGQKRPLKPKEVWAIRVSHREPATIRRGGIAPQPRGSSGRKRHRVP
jgi:hypothetical protein